MITQETENKVLKFSDDRNWAQFHTPKDLAISLCLEAAELLEVFQWSGTDQVCPEKTAKVREELADVLSYVIMIGDAYKLDLDEILNEKIAINAKKYPVEKAYGSNLKYTEFD